MKHALKISVSRDRDPKGVVSCRSVSMREKLLTKLFGQKRQMMLLVPGDSVATVRIENAMEGGAVCE